MLIMHDVPDGTSEVGGINGSEGSELPLSNDLLDQAKLIVRRRIRLLRQERGLTQAGAAARVGLDQSQWSRLESGQTELDLDSMIRVHAALALHSFEDLFGVMPSYAARTQMMDSQAREKT